MLKSIKLNLLSFLIIFTLFSCIEEEIPLNPIVLTGSVVDISSYGASFNGIYRNVDNQVEEYGIIWSNDESPSLLNGSKISEAGKPHEEVEEFTITSTLEKNETYYVCAYIKSDDRVYYGNVVSFLSMGSSAPELNYHIPEQVFFGDTIEIIGENLYGLDNAKIFFNTDLCDILNTTDTSLKVVMPYLTEGINPFFYTGSIWASIKVYGANYTMPSEIKLNTPKLEELQPTNFYPKLKVSISGNYLIPNQTTLSFGDSLLNTTENNIENDYNSISFELPVIKESKTVSINVIVAGQLSNSVNLDFKYPEIESISPSNAFSGDTLTLSGTNLEYLPEDGLYFRQEPTAGVSELLKAQVISKSDYIAKLILPDGICSFKANLLVYYGGDDFEANLIDVEKEVNINTPEITDVSPAIANWGDLINISGKFFPIINTRYISILCNGVAAIIVSNDKNNIILSMPPSSQTEDGSFDIAINYSDVHKINITDAFSIPSPIIDSISPKNPAPLEKIYIYGKNFNNKGYNTIKVDNSTELSTSILNDTCIVATIPASFEEISYQIQVFTNNQASTNTQTINVMNRWKQLTNLPSEITDRPVVFAIGDKIYIGGGEDTSHKNFYEYNTETNNFTQLGDLPAINTLDISFSSSTLGYILTSSNLFSYNPNSDSWSILTTIPPMPDYTSNSHYSPAGCYISNHLHLSYSTTDNYKYSIEYNAWEEIGSASPKGLYSHIAAFPINDDYYINIDFYNGGIFNTLNNSWSSFSGKDMSYYYGDELAHSGFEYKDKGFIFDSDKFLIYSQETGGWVWGVNLETYIVNPATVRIGSKAYVISGNSEKNGIWEYLLDRPEE